MRALHRCFLILASLLPVIALFWGGCGKNPTGPRDPRQVQWQVDTLRAPNSFQTLLDDIWASSPTDVYAVGHSSRSGKMWHFDGKTWRIVWLEQAEGGPIAGAFVLEDIYGFGPDDVWAVGGRRHRGAVDSALVIHFDGRNWHDIPTPPARKLTAVWGRASNDLWLAGLQGALFHYDGVAVRPVPFPLPVPVSTSPDTFYVPASMTGTINGEVYVILANNVSGGGARTYLLACREGQWRVEDEFFPFDSNQLWLSPSGTLYASGPSVYIREGGTWRPFLSGYETLWSIGIHGSADDNIFLAGRSVHEPYLATVYHYNGRDWHEYTELNTYSGTFYEIWYTGGEVFTLGHVDNLTIVAHGK